MLVEQSVDVMMTSEVGDDRAGRRHEQDHSGTVARDHAADEIYRWRGDTTLYGVRVEIKRSPVRIPVGSSYVATLGKLCTPVILAAAVTTLQEARGYLPSCRASPTLDR